MSRLRSLIGSAAAVALTAAAWVALPGGLAGPAAASACTSDAGVTVVVDYNELGGIQAGCASGSGGKTADDAFADAGFTLSYVRDDPSNGFVCRVAGLPSGSVCGNTPPADAYWGLWYSDGTSGTWSYASRGVNQLKVPDGSFVAFAWHQGGGRAEAPGVAPRRSAPPAPTRPPTKKSDRERKSKTAPSKPTQAPSTAPSDEPTAADPAVPSESPSESAKATKKPSKKSNAPSDSASPSADESSDVPTVDDITEGPPEGGTVDDADDGGADDGLPLWVPVVAILVVAAAGGAVVLRRRLG